MLERVLGAQPFRLRLGAFGAPLFGLGTLLASVAMRLRGPRAARSLLARRGGALPEAAELLRRAPARWPGGVRKPARLRPDAALCDRLGAMEVSAWLVNDSRGLGVDELVAALGERLKSLGAPVKRISTSVLTKHPEVFVVDVTWIDGHGATRRVVPYSRLETATYDGSPAMRIRDGADLVRCRPGGAGASEFERELLDNGVTDYVALALVFGDGRRTFVSFVCCDPGGFGDAQLALLEALRPSLTLRFELEAERHATRSLLEVYLGRNAAERVLSGAFRRGTGELVPCAIVFADMRGFTDFADHRAPAEVVATLDRYFEAVAGPLQDEGGEVLKFIGDAVLAVFRHSAVGARDASPADACARALRGSERALAGVAALEPLRVGFALHFGEVMYGNIGAHDRLDFTVIGAAVNEACRVESLCKLVKRPLLMTSAFVRELGPDARIESLGAHSFKGVGRSIEVHALRP
jgi:adenylate cyclase